MYCTNTMKDYDFTSSFCLQPYNSGFDGFQSTTDDSDISMMMGSDMHTLCSNDYLGIGMDDNYYQHQQFTDGTVYTSKMSIENDNIGILASPPPLMDYPRGWSYESFINAHSSDHLGHSYGAIKNPRKCALDIRLGQRNHLVSNQGSLGASKMSKKRKTMEQLIDARHLKTPIRRSQKLSDKITALQEVVSPYGKTDTASVLQEACIYIKIFHQELRRLSISYFAARSFQSQLQGNVDKQADLRDRGLCLVPVSTMKSLTKESWGDQHQVASRSTIKRFRHI